MNQAVYKITNDLRELSDERYADFQSRIIPTLPRQSVLGVRIPLLRKYAKGLSKEDTDAFLACIPHEYYDENVLHAILLSKIRDHKKLFCELELFLPQVDNWAVCDVLRPRVLTECREELLRKICKWLKSEHVYTVRFAVEMLMLHFLDEHFKGEYLEWVSNIKSSEYYVKMMCAWYFAEALVKQYDSAIAFFEKQLLDGEVFAMAVKKARESFRVDQGIKQYLAELEKKRKQAKKG